MPARQAGLPARQEAYRQRCTDGRGQFDAGWFQSEGHVHFVFEAEGCRVRFRYWPRLRRDNTARSVPASTWPLTFSTASTS
jgi:hypothetical protein